MTVKVRPTLRETQAVGALLLHQFAQERFREANLDVRPIREAEESLGLNELADSILHEQPAEESSNSSMEFVENTEICEESRDQSNTSHNQTIHNNSTASTFPRDCSGSLNGSSSLHNVEENYHSIANISEGHDGTLYHSLNQTTTAFDRLQASPTLASYGRELRRIAEEFEKSRLRQAVKERASNVKIRDLTTEGKFVELLEELFQGKITREKIVILFFFCTDVALRAAESVQGVVANLIGWSFKYIIDRVCSFVHQLGGWDKVLFYQLPSILITCCAALAIVSLVVYLKKNLLRGP